MNKKNWKMTSKALMGLSMVAIVLAGVGYLGTDIWLASTQWLLVSGVLAIFGTYAHTNK